MDDANRWRQARKALRMHDCSIDREHGEISFALDVFGAPTERFFTTTEALEEMTAAFGDLLARSRSQQCGASSAPFVRHVLQASRDRDPKSGHLHLRLLTREGTTYFFVFPAEVEKEACEEDAS